MPIHERSFSDAELLACGTDAEDDGEKDQHQEEQTDDFEGDENDGRLILINDEVEEELRERHETDEQ